MQQTFPESDWKKLRDLNPKAIERYCVAVLIELGALLATTHEEPQEKFLEICRLSRDREKKMATIFNGLRRPTAFMNLCHLRSLGLITDKEFYGFSKETREMVEDILKR